MSMWRTPNGASASTTALTIAGVAPMVPASPTPFTPSGLTGEGVSVRSSSNHGNHSRFRHRVVHQRSRDELALLVVDDLFIQRLA